MAPILSFLLSCGSKKMKPRFICLSEAKSSLRFKTWIVSRLKKVLRYTIHIPQKPPTIVPPLGSPEGPYIVECPTAGHFLYPSKTSSFRFPNIATFLAAPTMSPLRERSKAPSSNPQVPGRQALLQVPQPEPLWEKMPVSRAFLLSKSPADKLSSRFPKTGAPI